MVMRPMCGRCWNDERALILVPRCLSSKSTMTSALSGRVTMLTTTIRSTKKIHYCHWQIIVYNRQLFRNRVSQDTRTGDGQRYCGRRFTAGLAADGLSKAQPRNSLACAGAYEYMSSRAIHVLLLFHTSIVTAVSSTLSDSPKVSVYSKWHALALLHLITFRPSQNEASSKADRTSAE